MSTKEPIAYVERKECTRFSYFGNQHIWFSENCQDVAYGLEELGYTVKGFVKEDLPKLPITKDTIVRGSIRTTRTALHLLGVPQPEVVNIPKCLEKFAKRKIWTSTLGKVRKAKKDVFIKPLKFQKTFSGQIVEYSRCQRGISYKGVEGYCKLYELPNSFEILASEVVEFLDENRTFVLNGKIVGTTASHKNELRLIKEIINAYKNAPAAYAIDTGFMVKEESGILDKGTHALVEINSGFSAGNLADLSPKNYAKIMEASWFEMVGRPIPRLKKK